MIEISKKAIEYMSSAKPVAELREFSLRAAEEGAVLLKNEHDALPFDESTKIALFGRMQHCYLKGGTGSGNNNCGRVASVCDALTTMGADVDRVISGIYELFATENPYDNGTGWHHPHSQKELVVSEAVVAEAAKRCDAAVYFISRTAGEDKDQAAEKGSYYFSDDEMQMLKLLRAHFGRVVLLLNTCGVVELTEAEKYCDAILCLWQAGMDGGTAAAALLMGWASPSGRLPDTFARTLDGYPAYNYGSDTDVFYSEDRYVGYRYFSTFAPEKVLYPFGHGLSYTEFQTTFASAEHSESGITLHFDVKNVGKRAGKEVVQVYLSYLGEHDMPHRILAGLAKTEILQPGKSKEINVFVDYRNITLYDDINGGYYLPKGIYALSVGDSLSGDEVYRFEYDGMFIKDEPCCLQEKPFDRLTTKGFAPAPITSNGRTKCEIPKEMPHIEKHFTLTDVHEGICTVDQFVASLSDTELACLTRGEGMSSPKGTPGSASVFGGITEALFDRDIPIVNTTDGPAGVRLSSNVVATALPSGTTLAATFNCELVKQLYEFEGYEVIAYDCDVLLAPGVNIHRSPLCGRNFEYYSEDPLLAGLMASAACIGLNKAGAKAVVKHYMANSQEHCRYTSSSVISERAIREIYARPFEIAVREGKASAIMTSYNRIGGRWAASNEPMAVLLRDRFGFDGLVMTDWWAKLGGCEDPENVTDFRSLIKAQNDIYMVLPDALTHDDNIMQSLSDGSLTRGELQRSAKHIISFVLETMAFAKQVKYGKQKADDIRRIAETAEPFAVIDIVDGRAEYVSDSAVKAVAEITFDCNAEGLEQVTAALFLNTKGAGVFAVPAGVSKEYCTLSLICGKSEIVVDASSPAAKALQIKLYKQ